MNIAVSNRVFIKEPSEAVKAFCRKELTFSNPEYVRKARLGYWTGSTPAEIRLYEIHGDTWSLPYGCLKSIEWIVPDKIESRFAEPTYVDYGNEIELYDYQKVAVEAMRKARFGILQSQAGSGKTQMGIALIQKWCRRALWITHTHDLLKQSKDRALRYINKDLIGTIEAGKVNIGKGITFATVQTLCKQDLTQLRDYWDVIIVDECHRVAASAQTVTMFAKVLNNLAARHKYGLTATPHRADGLINATFALIGDVAYKVPKEATAEKTMQVTVQPVNTFTRQQDAWMDTDGTLVYAKMITDLGRLIDRNLRIINIMEQNRDRPSLILSDRIEHLERLYSMLPPDMKAKAAKIDGKMTSVKGKLERAEAISKMRSGELKYLLASYSLAKEGLDIPCLECLYLTTPQKDYSVVIQSIGRIARTNPNKKDPVCYDFVDDTRYLVGSWKKRLSIYRKGGCKVNGFR